MGEEWSNLKVLFMPHSFKDLTSLAFLYSARVLLTRLQRQRISRAEDTASRVIRELDKESKAAPGHWEDEWRPAFRISRLEKRT